MTAPLPGGSGIAAAVSGVPAVDTANKLLGFTPAILNTAIRDTPAGQLLAVTIRTASTTLTVFLQGADARAWAAQLTSDAAMMSGTGIVAASSLAPR